MVTKISHICIYVLDQESAYDFYVNKLGLNVHTDAPLGNARWLTLTTPDQPELQISLKPVVAGMDFTEESAQKMRELVQAGSFGFGVFQVKDLNAAYEELKTKGVEFIKPPTKEFYGTEALFKDDSGNWFSLGTGEQN